ncbi:hypothetical protein Lser_V15G12998 [Lactuca serriola]
MADSSSVHATSHILPIRPQQSLIIDLSPHVYDAFMFPIIECLRFSPIAPALTRAESVPMEFLSQIFATAQYDKVVDRIFFDIFQHKASISKQQFCSLLGFEADSTRVNLETIPMGHLFNMFYNMGYTEVLTSVAKFKKSCLPPQWNRMFTVLFKGLSEGSSGSDGASRLFLSIMYGVYNGINMDYGSILWQQLIQSLSSTSRHSEISYARFWTLVTKWVMDKYHVPIVAGAPMSSIGTFHTTKIIISDASKFPFNGSIPESMYGDVPADSQIIRTYKEFKRSGPRDLTPEILKSIHEADKPAPRGKKAEKGKKVAKGAKGPSPKKRKSTKAAQSPQQKRRKTQPRRKLVIASSSSESEGESSGSEDSPRGNTPPRSRTPEIQIPPSPIPSPPNTIPTSIPTINPFTHIPNTSIPMPPPIFTDATTTSTADVRANVSDTGVHTDAPETTPAPETTNTSEPTPTPIPETTQPAPTHTTVPPASPLPHSPGHVSEGEEPFLGGENMTFDSVYYSLFQVQSDDDDDAPVIKKHLKELHDKVDLLIASSSTSQSSLSEAAIQKIVDAFSKAQQDSLASATSAIDASRKACQAATEKVDKLFSDASILLKSLHESADAAKTTLESIVQQLATSVSTELKSFASLRQTLSNDNSAFRATIDERLSKLQEDLAAENLLMDVLAKKTTALKVKSVQLSNSQQEVDSLRSEREVIKSCVSDVHSAISNILEAHDPILNYTMRRDLAEKLAPALALLSKIEGLLDFVSIPKQGGEKESISQPPQSSMATQTTEPPSVGQASGSGVKDKGKNVVEEEDKETIADLLKRRSRCNVADDSDRVAREAEEAERKQKEAHDLLEIRKTLFPDWTLERMIKEAIDTPSILWLEPVISLDCSNNVDSQFDMSLTRKAFIFHAFSNVAEFPHPHPQVDRDLIDFYLKAAQPPYQTWSAQKIINVRVLKPYTEGKFINVRFKVLRGSAKTEHAISLADLPNLNPHDWIILHNILLTNKAEYGPIIDHLKRMLVCYIMEVALIDQEIASVLKKKPKISPVGSASDLNQMQMGRIDSRRNSVMFTRNEGQKCLFALADKHMYTTAFLDHVLGIIYRCKQNSADDIKYFDDMIHWYIRFRQTILALISRLFDTTKKVPAAGASKKKKQSRSNLTQRGRLLGRVLLSVASIGLANYSKFCISGLGLSNRELDRV